MAALGLLITGGGFILLYAGFRGVPIVDTFRAALAGQPLPQGTTGTGSSSASSSNPAAGSAAVQGVGQVGGSPGTVNPSTGRVEPGTNVAPGAGTGSGGVGMGTGSAPGYQPPGGLYQA